MSLPDAVLPQEGEERGVGSEQGGQKGQGDADPEGVGGIDGETGRWIQDASEGSEDPKELEERARDAEEKGEEAEGPEVPVRIP